MLCYPCWLPPGSVQPALRGLPSLPTRPRRNAPRRPPGPRIRPCCPPPCAASRSRRRERTPGRAEPATEPAASATRWPRRGDGPIPASTRSSRCGARRPRGRCWLSGRGPRARVAAAPRRWPTTSSRWKPRRRPPRAGELPRLKRAGGSERRRSREEIGAVRRCRADRAMSSITPARPPRFAIGCDGSAPNCADAGRLPAQPGTGKTCRIRSSPSGTAASCCS